MIQTEIPIIRVIDDDEQVRASLQFALEAEGWHTTGYESALEFLSKKQSASGGLRDLRHPHARHERT